MGPVLALVVIIVGRTLPESPRWLMTHGRVEEAERELAKIEEAAMQGGPDARAGRRQCARSSSCPRTQLRLRAVPRPRLPHRTRSGRSSAPPLMITQSFLYNAIFFTYALVLTQFYGVSATKVPLYGLAFSVGNLIGPLVLAPLFDTVGRKQMISGTYIISGVLLAVSGWLFDNDDLAATSQTFVLDRHLLLRLRRRERRLPDRQRDLADRDPRRGDRGVLRDRPDLRCVRAVVLRMADRRLDEPHAARHRLPDRSRDHDRRRRRRDR